MHECTSVSQSVASRIVHIKHEHITRNIKIKEKNKIAQRQNRKQIAKKKNLTREREVFFEKT